ncbi:Arm DNA-binding domain-containing protein [Enterobacteriaceae bacterium C34A]
MAKSAYPTGVENHGGNLRIWFIYKGARVRENLGVPDTPKNRKVAGELRSSVCFSIKMGTFNYAVQFPESGNLKRFGAESREITVEDLAVKWFELKKLEVCGNTLIRYESAIKNMLPRVGGSRLASSITREDVLQIRRELLTGYKILKPGQKTPSKGRKVPTVINYMNAMAAVFKAGVESGYLASNPFANIPTLKRDRSEPDPLSREEFVRLIDACKHQQLKNMWALAVYTGIRHGELVSLAWEDIDLKAGTMMIRRNHTTTGEFTLPKTNAGTDRTVFLIKPALDVLRNQAEMTRLGIQYQIEVSLREYGRSTTQPCTFVFNPQITTRNKMAGYHYAAGSVKKIWDAAFKRAGLRHRNAYQSRHTYACWSLSAGANPNFIATQMGHADAQMVYKVYGRWMSEKNAEQIEILNRNLTEFAPSMPHAVGSGL